MKKKIIIGNWKNYLDYEESIHLSKKISKINISNNVRVMVSPNHLYLNEINQIFNETNIEVIAQNVTSSESKSDTGGITVSNLKNLNIKRSIVAHSESRIREKIPIAYQFVLCFEEIDQIPFNLLTNKFEIILAYEPVWAIGTGETASIDHINKIHKKVKLKLEDLSLEIPILYGGSVNPSNSRDILESDYVDGVLVGGASTKIDHFEGILNSI